MIQPIKEVRERFINEVFHRSDYKELINNLWAALNQTLRNKEKLNE